MRLANGEWSVTDEIRAAWKGRLRLPHNEFEILLRRHMGAGVQLDKGWDRPRDEQEAASNGAVRAGVTALMGVAPLRDAAKIAAFFPDDGMAGSAIAAAARRCATPAAEPARAAWALQAVLAGIYDNLPTNMWCSTEALSDGFRLALEDSKTPFAHHYASELSALYRLDHARRLFGAVPVGLRQRRDQHMDGNMLHLCAYMRNFADATFGAILVGARAEYDAQMKQRGITPLHRRLHPGPQPR